MEQTVDISEIIDKSKVGAFQVGVFTLCGLCLIMDGFDVQAMGYVAPALIRDWKITSAALTPAFTAALTGILVGSLMCSMIADKLGRRPVLVFITLAFSLLTLLTCQLDSIVALVALRFLAGVALGGIMPNAMTLVGELTPGLLRGLML